MPCDGIGDTIFALGFLKEYLNENNIANCCIVGCHQKERIYQWYRNDYDNYIQVPHWVLRKIYEASKTDLGAELFLKNKNSFFLAMPQGYYRGGDQQYYMLDKFTQIDAYKCCLYRLQSSSNIKRPEFRCDDISRIIEEYKLLEGRTVILTPGANTLKEKIDIFDELARKFLEIGYMVLTNITNKNDKVVKNTQGVMIPLDCICRVAEFCGMVIGMRSGLFDVLMFSNAKIIALYPIEDKRFRYFNITGFGTNKKVMQYVLSTSLEKDANYIFSSAIEKGEEG